MFSYSVQMINIVLYAYIHPPETLLFGMSTEYVIFGLLPIALLDFIGQPSIITFYLALAIDIQAFAIQSLGAYFR